MKKTICTVLVLVLCVSVLAACGGGGGSSDNPNVGTWTAVSVEAFGMESDIKEVFSGGATLELRANGNVNMSFDGDKANGKWTGSAIRLTLTVGGVDYPCTIDGDALVFEMMDDMFVIFTKDGRAPRNRASASSSEAPRTETPAPTQSTTPAPPAAERSSRNDPVLGIWTAYAVEVFDDLMDIISFYASGATLDLEANGNCATIFNGNDAEGKWDISGSELSFNIGGVEYEGSYEDDVLMFDMMNGLVLYFTKDGNPPAGSSAGDNAGQSSGGALADAVAWWDGHWYGTFYVYDTNDAYSDSNGSFFDIYAVIETAPDGPATVYLWSANVEMGTVFITISEEGRGAMGTVVANGGLLFDEPVHYGDWNIDPSTCRYSDMIEIREIFTDEDGDWFDYEFLLRPWGMDWEDVPYSEQPKWYDDWYLGVYKEPMLDVLREYDEMAHSAIR